MAVSASIDGICNIHTVRKGVFVRSLAPTNHGFSTINSLTMSHEGYIIFSALSANEVRQTTRKIIKFSYYLFRKCLICTYFL